MKVKTALFPRSWYIGILLLLCILASFLLRMYLLPNNLFFGPEQGVDFLAMKEIALNHKLTLIGAKTDIAGIFHGPIYYYLGAITFFFSHGNPEAISAWFILLNSLTVIPLYFLTKTIHSKKAGIITALLFTVSFEAITYSRWLSSHPLSIPLVTLFILSLVKFLKGEKKQLLFAAIFFGLLGQTEFLNFIFFSFFLLCCIGLYFDVWKKQSFRFLLFNLVLVSLCSLGNYFLFDLRHQFLITKSVLSLLTGHTDHFATFLQTFTKAISEFVYAFTKVTTPVFLAPGTILLLVMLGFLIYQGKKQRIYLLLLFWLITPIIVLTALRHDILQQFFVSIIPAVIISLAILLTQLWKRSFLIAGGAILLFIFVNIYAWYTLLPENRSVFFQATQPNVKLTDEKYIIRTLYADNRNQPFGYHVYTIPYQYPQAWQYLFWYYGKPYAYQPADENAKMMAIIVQKDTNWMYTYWINREIHADSKILKSFTKGVFTVTELDFRK